MPTPEQWRQFHYPKPPNTTPKKQKAYKLMDIVQNSIIVQGNYALCVSKQKNLTIKTKIERV